MKPGNSKNGSGYGCKAAEMSQAEAMSHQVSDGENYYYFPKLPDFCTLDQEAPKVKAGTIIRCEGFVGKSPVDVEIYIGKNKGERILEKLLEVENAPGIRKEKGYDDILDPSGSTEYYCIAYKKTDRSLKEHFDNLIQPTYSSVELQKEFSDMCLQILHVYYWIHLKGLRKFISKT